MAGGGAPVQETPPAAKPVSIASRTGTLAFSYGWPSEAAAVPELDRWLRGNAAAISARVAKQAAAEAEAAKGEDWVFHAHSYEETYKVVADTPAMLVLLSDGYVYTGGAHGMPINTAIIWDKTAKRRLATSLLLDIPALASLVKQRFCDALDAQRAEKRGAPVDKADANQLVDFVRCVDMTKQLILPVSKGGKAFDTLRIVIGPYEAGPYAEGSYVIDIPIDALMMRAVEPAFREAFAPR